MDRYILCLEATAQIIWTFRVPVVVIAAVVLADVIRDARRKTRRNKIFTARGAR